MNLADAITMLLPVAAIAVIWGVLMLNLRRRKDAIAAGKPVPPLRVVVSPRLVYLVAAGLFALSAMPALLKPLSGEPIVPYEIFLSAAVWLLIATVISIPLWILSWLDKKKKNERKQDHF